ncbi:LPXTG cell wall anchor domain-containing protein [Streptomyces sp. DSM 110735]|uniref:LAETG motif-containing sortase-dependent surface protein n=1 Tax=Streptomyces sp. DSM 110735 TaxID=2775031 RepID=UPI0018F6AEF4|nr:LAETG motif-containing sortase-dependent surface protein [Streptomyces sp. DSM 110735]MBJ7904635.1 LPXTG cell wall anchor domain-containing protein [Streptomyces sp. DSM 110735]
MSISRRNARRSVRILGLASASAALVLGVSSQALACNIRDFSAEAVCTGDKGQIVVTDIDASKRTATVTVFLENNGADEKQVGEKQVTGAREGAKVSFDEDWQANATYRIHVKVPGLVDEDIKDNLKTPANACKKEDSPAPSDSASESAKPSPSETKPAEESASPSDSASESAAAPASDVPSNAPSAAIGDSNLAETGANSNTGLIAGVAGALVVVGGGAVYFGMRRRGAKNGG